jgi:hypothetical protein
LFPDDIPSHNGELADKGMIYYRNFYVDVTRRPRSLSISLETASSSRYGNKNFADKDDAEQHHLP